MINNISIAHITESTSHFANNLPTTTLEFENVTGMYSNLVRQNLILLNSCVGPNDIAKKGKVIQNNRSYVN